jgi:hypothetical protein
VNHGELPADRYAPAVLRAWQALAACVNPDGRLTHVQPVGGGPKGFLESSTAPYGVGAFLLAGSEVLHLSLPGGK